MRYFLAVIGITLSIAFLTVTLFVIPQYFFKSTVVKTSPDHTYEVHISLKRIPGGTLTELLSLYSMATLRIFNTSTKRYIGSAVTISGKHCINKYGKKSELIQWKDTNTLLVWCSDVYVLAKMSYDNDFTTKDVRDDRILQIEIYEDRAVSCFINPRSLFE